MLGIKTAIQAARADLSVKHDLYMNGYLYSDTKKTREKAYATLIRRS
jgi:hypothetical protein